MNRRWRARHPGWEAPKVFASLFLVIAFAGQACAHDFWLQPVALPTPSAGTAPLSELAMRTSASKMPGRNAIPAPAPEEIGVRILVGELLQGEELGWNPSHVKTCRVVTGDQVLDVRGEPGVAPAFFVPRNSSGSTLAAYESQPQTATLTAAKFRAYLAEHGFYALLSDASRGDTFQESFTRHCKLLIVGSSGADEDPLAARVLGHALEVVPGASIVKWSRRGGEVTLRVLREGKPAPGILLRAASPEYPSSPVHLARADETGRARFTDLPASSTWLFTAVEIEAPGKMHPDSWRSHWASFVLAPDPAFTTRIPSPLTSVSPNSRRH